MENRRHNGLWSKVVSSAIGIKKLLDNRKARARELQYLGKLLSPEPGPSPWYLTGRAFNVITKHGPAKWESLGKGKYESGKVGLKAGTHYLAIFDFNNWIRPLEGALLLGWNQVYSQQNVTNPINLFLLNCDMLSPIRNISVAIREMHDQEIPVYHTDGLVFSETIPTTKLGKVSGLIFPSPINEINEILVLARTSGIRIANDEKSNLCIMSITPRCGTVEFYPQDWFNSGGYDYGYQWVTRVARDPQTKKIYGEGVRIKSFILDSSNRNVEKFI